MSLSQVEISGVDPERPLLTPCSISDIGLLCPTLVAVTSESLSWRRLPSDSDLLKNDLQIINLRKLLMSRLNTISIRDQ